MGSKEILYKVLVSPKQTNKHLMLTGLTGDFSIREIQTKKKKMF